MKTNEELLKGAYYYTYNTTSTFDCYNQCIKNPTCDFAQSYKMPCSCGIDEYDDHDED